MNSRSEGVNKEAAKKAHDRATEESKLVTAQIGPFGLEALKAPPWSPRAA